MSSSSSLFYKSTFYKSVDPIYAKTPVPTDPELLGMLEIGASFLTEMIPDACVCGRPIAFLSYKASIERAKGAAEGLESTEIYGRFAKKYNLAACCRMRILAPVVCNVVSADIGARRIENGRTVEITDAPSALTSLTSSLPPQIISEFKKISQ